MSVAESCTGGKIAERITANSGASNYFKGSVVSYATEAKVEFLKVSQDIISKYSVVSSQVAEAMAKNVQKFLKQIMPLQLQEMQDQLKEMQMLK